MIITKLITKITKTICISILNIINQCFFCHFHKQYSKFIRSVRVK